MLDIKVEHHLSERFFDEIFQYVNEMIPLNNVIQKNFYETKRLTRGMNIEAEKINTCVNSCMIYWGEDIELVNSWFCRHPKYN